MKLQPVPGHPELRRGLLRIYGPKESKPRLIIVPGVKGPVWWYKEAGEDTFTYVGLVQRFRTAAAIERELRLIKLVDQLF